MVEVLVAIVIIGIGVLAPLALAVRNVPDADFVKNKLSATYLAKGQIELMISLVYGQAPALSTGTLLDHIVEYNACQAPNRCHLVSVGTANKTELDIQQCSLANVCQVTVGGKVFTRFFTLTELVPSSFDSDTSGPSLGSYKMDVTVGWRERNRDESVTLSRLIYATQ